MSLRQGGFFYGKKRGDGWQTGAPQKLGRIIDPTKKTIQ